MNVEQALRAGLERLKSNQLTNEAQVKQAVILPILRALGWDDTDPNEFVPELSVDYLDGGKGSVDYALHGMSPNRRPLVFLEAKKLGSIGLDGEEQLFGYANNKGVPFLVLTDGNLWNFYLAMADGIPAERRVYRAELQQEEKLGEYAVKFGFYLEKGRVLSGKARQEAEAQRESDKSRTVAQNAILGCWRTLVNEPEQGLIDLLVEAVERESGIRPDLDDVETFLKNQVSSTPSTLMPSTNPPKSQTTPRTTPPSGNGPDEGSSNGKLIGFVLDGVETRTGTAGRTLAEILKEFQRLTPEFLDRLYPKAFGRTRRLVAKNRDELYDVSHLRGQSIDLGNGWWVGTHLSTERIVNRIQLACNIADISFGTRLRLIYRD